MTKSQTEFFKMLDKKIDEVCVIPTFFNFSVHVVVFFQVSCLQVLLLLLQVLSDVKLVIRTVISQSCGNTKYYYLRSARQTTTRLRQNVYEIHECVRVFLYVTFIEWKFKKVFHTQIRTLNGKIFFQIVAGLWT